MKHLRVIIPLAATLAVVVVIALRAPRQSAATGFATPDECVAAYRDACKDGDVTAYRRCLSESLRKQSADPARLAESLRVSMSDVKSWTQVGPAVVDGDSAIVQVDEVRSDGTRRVRFRLERVGEGWLITAIDAAQDVPAPLPYGTRVGEEDR